TLNCRHGWLWPPLWCKGGRHGLGAAGSAAIVDDRQVPQTAIETLLPDGATTTDRCHNYQSRPTGGFTIKAPLPGRLIGLPGPAAPIIREPSPAGPPVLT